MWTVLNEEWTIRSSQDGLELMALERNISLELSDLRLRAQLFQILTGEREIPNDISEDTKRVINDLSVQKIIQVTEREPKTNPITEIERKLWKIRNKLVGSHGPVQEVYWLDRRLSKFSSIESQMFMAEYLEIRGSDKPKANWSFGISEDSRELAELKAIMEALERHVSGIVPSQELIKSSAKKLGKDAIDPRKVIAYNKRQYRDLKSCPFSQDREYYWKEVMTFPQRVKRYLPVECLYYPIDQSVAPHPYMFANSSGVAAGFSFEEALSKGLYEAIERDAFMATWLNRIVMPRIERRLMPAGILSRIERIEELGYKVFLANLTLDLMPVALAVIVSCENQPALVIGTASNSDTLKACSKAISETEQQLYWCLRNSVKTSPICDPEKVREIPDHAALYWTSCHLPKAKFLWSGEELPLNTEGLKITPGVEEIAGYLNSKGKEIIVADLTPSFLKKMGLWIVRVIPLGLIPITFGYGNIPLGMSRLREVNRGDRWLNNPPFVHPFS